MFIVYLRFELTIHLINSISKIYDRIKEIIRELYKGGRVYES